MAIEKLPSGTYGGRRPPSLLARLMMPLMIKIHRRTGNKLRGQDLLYLTTVGARTGKSRTAPMARTDGGDGSWIVVASAGGTTQQPGWYHNVCAHPDKVQAEVDGVTYRVSVEQLEGQEREQAWGKVVSRNPGFKSYLTKTDRTLPVLRLTPLP